MDPVYCHERVSNNDSIYDCLVEYKVKYWGYLCEIGADARADGADARADAKVVEICKRWKKLKLRK